MKGIFINKIILSFCLISIATSCKKTQLELLPPASTTGSNTFGCLIDGKAFIGKNSNEFFSTTVAVQGGYNKGLLYILGSYYSAYVPGGGEFGVSIYIQTKHTGTITVPGNTGNSISYSNSAETFRFSSDMTHTSSVNITRFDTLANIYSGTFQGTLVDTSGKVVNVSDGRFDFKSH